jgi:acetylornithine deacetylase/succinyl-diaminopimelate desuccinylase-like protein
MIVEKEISTAIKEYYDDFLDDLAKIIEVQSIRSEAAPHAPFGKGPRKVLDVVVEIADRYGFKTGIVNDAVAYAQWGDDNEHYIGIVGHLDVVAAGEGWQSDPFQLTARHGKLYARGILDNKGPIMSTLFGMKLLKDMGFKPQKTIRILFGSDEESGSADIPLYLKSEPAPDFGFTPDCKFPTVYGERGIVNYEIKTPIDSVELSQISTIEGDQAKDHVPDELKFSVNGRLIEAKGKRTPTNAPELGTNAIMILAQKVLEQNLVEGQLKLYFEWLLKSFDNQHFGEGLGIDFEDEDSGKLIVTPYALQKTEGGLKLEVAMRYPVSYTEDDVTNGLKMAVLPDSIIEITRQIPGTMHDKNDPNVKILSRVYERITGLNGTPVTTTGATYARSVPNIIAFGPSFPGQKGIAHKQDEWMAQRDLKMNMEIYMDAILNLIKAKEG